MERQRRETTPYGKVLSNEVPYERTGIVLVLAHQSKNGAEILMQECKQTRKTEEDDFGLPSETEKVNVDTNQTEPKPSAIRRLGTQELGFDFKNLDLFFSPRKTYFETPFPLTIKDEERKPIEKINALGRVVVLWTRNKEFLPEKIDNKEVKGARFESFDQMLKNPQNYQFRENSYRIIGELAEMGYLYDVKKYIKFRDFSRYPHYIYTDEHLGRYKDIYVRKK